MPRRNKIALIGAGNIGGELAALAAREAARRRRPLRHPRQGGPRQGQGARPRAERRRPRLRRATSPARPTGTTAPAPTSSSSPPACRASRACRATISLSINLKIIRNVAENVKANCPDAFVIVISNPLDAMVYELKKRHRLAQASGSSAWPACSTRRASAVPGARARRLGRRTCAPWCSAATATHGAGDLRTAPSTACRVKQLIAKDKLDAIVDAHAQAAAARSSSSWAPAPTTRPRRRRSPWPRPTCSTRSACCPCAGLLRGRVRLQGPLHGRAGASSAAAAWRRSSSIELTDEEKAQLDKSAAAVRELVEASKKL